MLTLVPYNGKGHCTFCLCDNKEKLNLTETEEVDMDKLMALYNNRAYTEVEVDEIIRNFKPRQYKKKVTKRIHYAMQYDDGSELTKRHRMWGDLYTITHDPQITKRSVIMPICDACLRSFFGNVNDIMDKEEERKNKKKS